MDAMTEPAPRPTAPATETPAETVASAPAATAPETTTPEPAKPAAAGPPVIAIDNLSLTFQTGDGPVEALSNINLSVNRGEFVSLIGPSGCGKTTLLRLIADLQKPTIGGMTVNGVTPEEARLKRAYGYVFQAAALYPWRTIARNVALPLEIMGLPRAERDKRVRDNLALVNLTGFERKYPVAAFRRHAAAGVDRPGARRRAGAAADGRAVRGARRDRPRPPQRAAPAAVGEDRQDGDLRHPLDPRGSVPVDPDRRDVAATRQGLRRHHLGPAAERTLDIRETPAFLKIAHRVREGLRAGHSYED